jgi:cytochrome c-type biogenesis protein CcmF
MPWLVGTALLHSAIVTEKRGALQGWTVFLSLAAFSFSMLGAFLVRSGVLTSVHAFAVDPRRGVLLLSILALASGTGFALFAWRAPKLTRGGLFAPVSREGALVLNNLFLAGATVTVMLGTLYPLIRQALTAEAISVGAPYFTLTFAPLMAACLLILPAGPLLAWKRGDLAGALQRLWVAAAAVLGLAVVAYAVVSPRKLVPVLGLALGAWLIAGSLAEVAGRVKLGAADAGEVWRRTRGLPRAAWGMTLAHIGLGVFVLGACFETAWRLETAQALSPGQSLRVGAYTLMLRTVGDVDGPNYAAERAVLAVAGPGSSSEVVPERRFYPANRQTVSHIAIERHGASDLYVVLGERSAAPDGRPRWLVRAFWNPWARLIFAGPILMALGGAVSLSDRRLRLAVGRRAPAPSPLLEPAE